MILGNKFAGPGQPTRGCQTINLCYKIENVCMVHCNRSYLEW